MHFTFVQKGVAEKWVVLCEDCDWSDFAADRQVATDLGAMHRTFAV